MCNGRGASKFVVSIEPLEDAVELSDIEIDGAVKRKKNFWNKSYKASGDREAIVDMFCAEFAHTVGDMAERRVEHNQMIEMIRKWNRNAERFAVAAVDFKDGWKIHKDWFKCMLAQLYLAGAKESDAHSYTEYVSRAKSIFDHLGWSFENARHPTYDSITTVYDINYRYRDNGVEETRSYRVMLEPTTIFPTNAQYESSTGKVWEVLGANDLEVELISATQDKNGNYPTLKMLPNMVHKMKRVL